MVFKYFLLLAAFTLQSSHGARILFYFGFSGPSDRIAVWPLVEALAEKGHRIHFLSPFPPNETHPNVTEIQPPHLVDLMNESWGNVIERRRDKTYEKIWTEIREKGIKACNAVFADRETRDFLKDSQFDLVIVEALYNECGIGLAYYYGSPFILYVAGSIQVWQPDAHGYFPETSWVPDVTKDYPLEMTFLQKVFNTLNPVYWHFARHWHDFIEMDKILWSVLQIRKMPPLEELEKNVSLVLYNNHFSTEFPRSLPPLYVSVAGMHCQKGRKVEPLSQEIENFINSKVEGLIYINFGPAFRFAHLKESIQKTFFHVLAEYEDVAFIWKWDDKERPRKMPKNVLTLKWVPQQAILAHPKIRAFINHAGLLSIQEAITYAVPLIVMPIYIDQNYNAEKVARQGYGIRLEFTKLKKEGLNDAISNILNEPKYHEKAAVYSSLFHDRPMKPTEAAVWWTEYVLRHGTGAHLRPHAQTHNWLQRRSLDVYAFLLTLLFFLMIVMYILMRQAIIMLISSEDDEYVDTARAKKRRMRLIEGRDEMEPLVEESEEKDVEVGEDVEDMEEDKSRPGSPSEVHRRPNSQSDDLSRPVSPSSTARRSSLTHSHEPLDPRYVKSKDA